MGRVQLDELSLVNFRNIATTRLQPGPRFNVISGVNGSGKTNLVESVYLLGALRSFRTSTRSELLRSGTEVARVRGVFGEINAGLTCEMTLSAGGRKMRVDDVQVAPDGGHFRSLPMVLFHPGNMEMVQGGPDVRRRFIDRALFQAEPGYPQLHRSYGRALASRNRILKDPNPDRRALEPFDVQLANLGAEIVRSRARFIEAMSPVFEEAVSQISGGNTSAMVYRPRVDGDEESLVRELAKALPRDTARGYTSVGPHADDVGFHVDDLDTRKYASQGQQRTVVLAAKIAETRVLTEATGRVPLLLLDDVSSELDRERNRKLFDFLATGGGQVFITTTHRDHIHIPADDRSDYEVKEGGVTSVSA